MKIITLTKSTKKAYAFYFRVATSAILFSILSSVSLFADDVILLQENASKRVLVPKSAVDATWRTSLDFNDSSWRSCTGSPGGVGYEKSNGFENFITLDVGDDMHNDGSNPNTSCYIRIKFNVDSADLAAAKYLTLLMRYDDGFAAWLNGTKIAEANVPNPLAWNSTTGGSNESAEQAAFDVSSHLDKFVAGENILAIQGVNAGTSSSDFLINASLVSSTTRYGDFSSSNLPIIFINTNGQAIIDDPRIVADMGIIYNGPGERNNVDDPFNHYSGKIGIELRGATSRGYPKKHYRVETTDENGENNNVSLFGMPEENDWVLNNPYNDKTFMRNILSYNLSNEIGHYAPRTQPVEVFLNNNYQGIYVFMEKIKRDKGRVDIAKLDADDVAGDSLTGGYIIKVDKGGGQDNESWRGKNVDYQYHYPKPRDIQPEQRDYIKNYVLDLERVMQTDQFDDPVEGYHKYLDVSSMIDYFIMNEVLRNVDGYRISTYMYKDKDREGKVGKLTWGPLWDFNLSLGVSNWSGDQTDGWNLDLLIEKTAHEYTPPFYWQIIPKTDDFQARLLARWTELREDILDVDRLHQYIDTLADTLDEARVRDYKRWNHGGSYTDRVNHIKTWLAGRIAWMDENITGEGGGGNNGGGNNTGGDTPTGDDITDENGTIHAEYEDSPEDEGIDNLIDNDDNTKFLTFHSSAWVEYRHPEVVAVNGYGITSANDAPDRDPRAWEFLGWDENASSWVMLHAVSNEAEWPERFQRKTFAITNSKKYSRYRLSVSELNGGDRMQIAELEIYAKVIIDSDDITDLGGAIAGSHDDLPWGGSNSGSPDGERIEKLIDNDINTKYLVGQVESWVTYTINEQARVTGYAITSANDAQDRDPRSWQLQGRDDLANKWVTLHSVTHQPTWEERFQTKSWNFANTDKWFSTYRLNILEINGDSEGLMQMAELELFGDLESQVDVENQNAIVNDYRLEQNYPNPFNPTTRIQFSMPASAHVRLDIYNTLGQRIKTLTDQQMQAGAHSLLWNGTNDSGETVSNGIYYYRLNSDIGVLTKKMLFLR
jgi:hypothetical protein